ncbi:hypothetical protein GS610_02330 [Ruegeria sp. HKCCD6228]|uniref:hypothetical protein n=1 Tax=Ruegeria sp. HKCCA5463 TaxID=2682994 RepID=UPI00148791F0|nr:hypothetical protein [Ruegeria sp. HKCCA5463]NOD96037.1 hypothetical protein [Ruegeria sp. HKCCD6228]
MTGTLPDPVNKLNAWLGGVPMLTEGHEPGDLHHYLLHYLLIYQAGRFLSFSSLRQVAKPAPTRKPLLFSRSPTDDDDQAAQHADADEGRFCTDRP